MGGHNDPREGGWGDVPKRETSVEDMMEAKSALNIARSETSEEKVAGTPKPRLTAADILAKGADTYRERNPIYGDNWPKIAKALMAMFPDGITLSAQDDFERFYFLVVIVAKLSRYANNFTKGGHQDSIHDITVYAAMLEAIDRK